MALTRRQFLKRTATLAAGATVAPAMRWLPGTGVAYAGGPSDAIVVFVQLFGGNDGLNTVYPVSGAQRAKYEEIRPTLKLPKDVPSLARWTNEGFDTSNGVLSVGLDSLNDEYALNPAMKALHDIYLDGNLAVVPGVHYPWADYSHFRSEIIYYTGDPIGTSGFGWMGKYLDLTGFDASEVPGVMLGGDFNPLFTPTTTSLFAFKSLAELQYPAASRGAKRSQALRAMYAKSGESAGGVFPELGRIGNTGVAALDTFEEYYRNGSATGKVEALMLDGDGNYKSRNDLAYPSPLNSEDGEFSTATRLGQDLRHVAAVIRSNIGARFFHVGIGGFDTHNNQENGLYHSHLLHEVSEAIGAFWAEMKSTPSLPAGYLAGDLTSRVLIVTLSEFGRTTMQNNNSPITSGTDHGLAAPQIIVGPTVQAGMHGPYPSLDDPVLDNDLRMTHDFRDLYGTILERWLNVPASAIGPGAGKLFAATPTPDWLGLSYIAYTPIPFLLP